MEKITLIVDEEEPLSLQSFLMKRRGVSRRLLNKLKRVEGGMLRNGEPVRSVDAVRKGDVIELRDEEVGTDIEPNPSLRIPVVWENESAVVFDKPAGAPVHPSHKHRSDTLGNYFAAVYKGLAFRPINRLDKDTSGLCLVAKDAYAAKLLQGSVSKVYYAAAEGDIPEEGVIDAPIAREEGSIVKRVVREGGRPALTRFRKIASGGGISLAEVILGTGRTHQIRVHFSHIGHALAGDDMYGGSREKIGRQALHCGRLAFTDPATGKRISVTSELPEDIRALAEDFGGVKIKEENIMEKIASFQVDHTKFGVGMYISRIDDDIVTYDVRMVKPNGGTYVSSPSLHTIEHLFATYARNSEYGKNIVYVGPMGCRTGFYLLTRGLSHEKAISLVRDAYRFIADFDGEIPGCTAVECGNYLEHDLAAARRDVLPLLEKLKDYPAEALEYSYHFDKE